jgi:hypothetical protein
MIKEDFVKRISSGQPTKYDPKKHIGLLFDVFNKGEGVMAFCADAMISQKTFFSWLKKHREFSEAYNVIINQAGRKWESYPIDPKVNIEFSYWSIIMRNRFGYGKSRFNLADKKTAKEMMQAAKEHLDDNMISTKDYSSIVDSAKTQALIDTQIIDEKLKDNNLNITIERKDHENLDMLEDSDIRILRKEGLLTSNDIEGLKKKGRL